jgi:hypothetical protein
MQGLTRGKLRLVVPYTPGVLVEAGIYVLTSIPWMNELGWW